MGLLDSVAHFMMDNDKLHYNDAAFSSLTAEEKWLLTLSAPLSAFNGDYVNSIETGKTIEHIRTGVTEMWGVTNRQGFEETVERIVSTGQRGKFEAIWKTTWHIEELRAKAPAWIKFAQNIIPVFMPYYINSRLDAQSIQQQTGYSQKEFGQKFPNIASDDTWVHKLAEEFTKKNSFSQPVTAVNSLLAWDAVRLVSLTRWAVELGFIKRNEFSHFAGQLADEVKATYKSWEEISAAYIVAGIIWNNGSGRMDNLLRTNRMLLNESDSPYQTVQFKHTQAPYSKEIFENQTLSPDGNQLKKWEFSKKPVHYVYAALWLIGFAFIAVYIYSGKVFQPINGKINIIAIGVAWIVEYVGLFVTSMLFFFYGVYRSLKTVLVKNKFGIK